MTSSRGTICHAAVALLAFVCVAAIGASSDDGGATSHAISVDASGNDTASIPDFDGDGTIGFSDFVAFASKFGSRRGDAAFDARFDLDGDGEIGFPDFIAFASQFGKNVESTPPPNSPDLIIESPSVSARNLTPGQSFTLSTTIRNQGDGESSATMLRYYRSSNSTISRQDTLVGVDSLGSLEASRIRNESIGLMAPFTPGIYYYGACVTTVAGEAEARDNCSSSNAVTVWDSSRIVNLLEKVKGQDLEEHAALVTLSWIRDGVSPSESYAIETLTKAALRTDRVFSALLEKPWIKDGLNADEAFTIGNLVWIATSFGPNRVLNVESTLRILGMPFLNTFETNDYFAVRCLRLLNSREGGRDLRQVLDHPSFGGGITDVDTMILTGLWRIARFSPENVWRLFNILLDPDQTYRQERKITLPLAGVTTLMVIRITPGKFRTLDILEEILFQQEDLMNVAYPYNVAAIFNLDSEGPRGSAGGGILTLSPGHEEDFPLLCHELAHSYWFVPSEWWQAAYSKGITFTPFTWIAEGGATFLSAYANARDQLRFVPASPSDIGCSLFDTIGELDRKTYSPDTTLEGEAVYRSACNYSLGYGLFAGLFNRLGDREFRRGFGSLFLKMSNLEHEDECTGVETGLCYVRKAFVEDAYPGFGEAAREVINCWYYGGEPF